MGNSDDLQGYSVRLPRDLIRQLPKARILTGKSTQFFIGVAIREKLREIGVL